MSLYPFIPNNVFVFDYIPKMYHVPFSTLASRCMRGNQTRHCGGGSAIIISRKVFNNIFFWQNKGTTLKASSKMQHRYRSFFSFSQGAVQERPSPAEGNMFSLSAPCNRMTDPRTQPSAASGPPGETGQTLQTPSSHWSLISEKKYLRR